MQIRQYKKYPNRRLYSLDDSRYVKLLHIQHDVEKGHQVEVRTSDKRLEITREVLLDILKAKQLVKPTIDTTALYQLIRTGT